MSEEKKIFRDQFNRPIPHEEKAADPHKYVIEATVRLPDFKPPAPHHEESKPKWYQTIEGWKFAIECAVFVLGFIGAIIASICAFIYYGQMEANQTQARQAVYQSGLMQTNLMLEERAWVTAPDLSVVTAPDDTNKFSGIRTYLYNVGKTPATVENIFISVGASNSETGTFQTFLQTNGFAIDLASGSKYPMNLPTYNSMGEVQHRLVRERKLIYYFTIEITYRDIFGKVHHSNFYPSFTGDVKDVSPGTPFQEWKPERLD